LKNTGKRDRLCVIRARNLKKRREEMGQTTIQVSDSEVYSCTDNEVYGDNNVYSN
jgi:hypothetical protein